MIWDIISVEVIMINTEIVLFLSPDIQVQQIPEA